jgi:hypothetical protein
MVVATDGLSVAVSDWQDRARAVQLAAMPPTWPV